MDLQHATPDTEAILTKLESSMQAVGRQGRTEVRHAHFALFLSPSAEEHLSFAVPLLPNPHSWAPAVAEMQALFEAHSKRPRLEYMAELHPDLAAALAQAGMVCESRSPVMTLNMAALAPPPAQPSAAHYQRLTAEDTTLLHTFLINQSIAFGGTGGAEALGWLATLQAGLASGGVQAAVLWQGEAMVAGAVVQIGGGIGELAGVWTAAPWRRQGLGYALCQQLLADYTAAGYPLCWLSAAEGAQQLYEKLGFAVVGTQLNYGRHTAQ